VHTEAVKALEYPLPSLFLPHQNPAVDLMGQGSSDVQILAKIRREGRNGMTTGNCFAQRSGKERRTMMANVELNSREAGLLKEVLLRYYSDIRFEIADTDDREFLNFLKAREAFMRELIKRLERAERESLAM
jgi:hypothetical protein